MKLDPMIKTMMMQSNYDVMQVYRINFKTFEKYYSIKWYNFVLKYKKLSLTSAISTKCSALKVQQILHHKKRQNKVQWTKKNKTM